MGIGPEKLKELKDEIPFMWKVQTANDKNATCVAYIDSRDVQDMLDRVVGPENWSSEFITIGNEGRLFCKLGIRVKRENGDEWVYKMDTGTESKAEAEKGEVSDALKRSAVQWGIGRFLYSKEIQYVKTVSVGNRPVPCDDYQKPLYGDKLTEYINNKTKNKFVVKEKTNPEPSINIRQLPEVKEDTSWRTETITRAQKIQKDGLTGQACLKKFLPQFNKLNGTNISAISGIDDTTLNKLMDFIEKQPPEGI